jgi:hypothetical protein
MSELQVRFPRNSWIFGETAPRCIPFPDHILLRGRKRFLTCRKLSNLHRVRGDAGVNSACIAPDEFRMPEGNAIL